MFRNAALGWGLAVALMSFAMALAVYDFARAFPPDLLDPLQVSDLLLPLPAWLSGGAPSFLYTLAFALLIGIIATPQKNTEHCLAWISIAIAFEFAQLPALSAKLGVWLAATLPAPLWRPMAAYWTIGTFDPLDLAATVTGGLLALLLIRHFTPGVDS